jgi:hypothetical protein
MLLLANQELEAMYAARRTLLFAVAFILFILPLAVSAQSPLQFVPIAPCRVVDTRITGNPIQSETSQNFAIQGTCGVPPAAAAYSLNVTVVPHLPLGYLTIWPAGENQPGVSTMNSYDGRVKANAAIVGAGSSGGGAVSVYASNTTDVVLDIDGYFASANASTLAFYPVAPCRVADSRGGNFLPAGQESDFPVSGLCNIPSGAMGYSLNLTAIPRGPLGFLTVWPVGQSQPNVSTLNSYSGTVVANAAMVGAGNGGEVAIYPSNDTDLVIDIDGYYAPPSSAPDGLSLFTLTPCRILDTRLTSGAFDGILAVNAVQSPCNIPSLASALVLNATVIPTVDLGYLTLWPNGQMQPLASTLNSYDGAVTSNMAVTPITNGFVNAFASDSTQLVLDASSYFGVPGGLSGNYTFSVNGFNSGGPALVTGSFVADGAGNTTGVLDVNSAGGPPHSNVSFKGTYSIQLNGLGTMSITPTLNKTMTFAIAVASTGGGRLVLNNESNSYLPNTWGSGAIQVQNPSAFSLQQIAGSYASGSSGVDPSLNRFAAASAFQIDQTGRLTGFTDTNDNGTVANNVPTAASLVAPDPTTGRGTAMFVTKGILTHWVYYVTSANALTFLSSDPVNSPANLLQETALRQGLVSFANSSLSGVSVLSSTGIAQSQDGQKQAPAAGVPDVVLGLLTTDGNGGGSVSLDQNAGGTHSQETSQGTYSVAANGRVMLTGFGSNTPPVLYLVNQNQGFLVGQDNTIASGYAEPQSGLPFSNASVIGTYWGGSIMPATASVTDSVTGAFADGNGNLTGTTNTSGSGGSATVPVNAVYSVDGTGRITLNGSVTAILYVVSPTKTVVLPAIDPNPALAVWGSTN